MFIPVRDYNPARNFPVVTLGLISVNALVFLLDRGFNPFGESHFIGIYAMIPLEFYGDFLRAGGLRPFWLSLFTAMFMHANLAHLLGNMWYLWLFGNNIEDKMGRTRFLILYLLWGAAAGGLHILVSTSPATPTVGASGAMAGVLGAYMLLFPRAEIEGLWWAFILFVPGQLPALVVLGFWFFLQFAAFQPGVAYWAHIGGFVAGMLTVLLIGRSRLLATQSEPLSPEPAG